MAATESWVLNGLDISSGNYQILELTADPPKERPEWITAADSEFAALSRQPRHENRTITMRLRITPQASMDTALDRVGALVDQLRNASETSDGIPLVWTPANSTRSRTFDVLDGEITELPIGSDGQPRSWFAQRPIVTVEMTCKPYWRGTETLTSTASSGTNPFVTLEVAGVGGDIPALGRLIVTDLATQSRRHVEWGVEGQYYVSGVSPSLRIDSGSLTVSGFSGSYPNTRSGSFNTSVVRSTAFLGSDALAICGIPDQTHVGTFRVKARVLATDITDRVRLAWRAGDAPLAVNSWVQPPVASTSDWAEIDLGLITVPTVTIGTQRWNGRIEIYSTDPTVSSTVDVDYIVLIPVAEGYGVARATYAYSPGVIVARDLFTGTTGGGALNTRVAPLGGTWATSGATTDFTFADVSLNNKGVIRQTTGDTGSGRFAILGSTNYTDTEVGARIFRSAGTVGMNASLTLVARFVDSSNYLAFAAQPSLLTLFIVVGGSTTILARKNPPTGQAGWANIFWRLRLFVYANGRIIGHFLDDGFNIRETLDAFSTAAATGGALATGKPGLNDNNFTATAMTRAYDDFYAATPSAEPIALYSGRVLQARYDDTLRQDSTGTFYGRPASYRGSRFLVPVGISRVIAKARRNDVNVAADNNVADATQIQVGWTPRGLVVNR